MANTHEEACTKICIHSRQITPDGKCIGNQCMAWSYIHDFSRVIPGEIPKGIPTNKGRCELLKTIKVAQASC